MRLTLAQTVGSSCISWTTCSWSWRGSLRTDNCAWNPKSIRYQIDCRTQASDSNGSQIRRSSCFQWIPPNYELVRLVVGLNSNTYAFWTDGTSVRLLRIKRSYRANQDRLALHTNSCCLASNNAGQYCNSSLRQRDTIDVMMSMWAAHISTWNNRGHNVITYFEWSIAEERFVPNR